MPKFDAKRMESRMPNAPVGDGRTVDTPIKIAINFLHPVGASNATSNVAGARFF